MIHVKFKNCCYNCTHRETFLKEEKIYNDNCTFDVVTVIGCIHECVCKEYKEKETKNEH